MKGLGRLPAPDARDLRYPMRALVPVSVEPRTYRYWYQGGWWGDQNGYPQCVGYSWTHWLTDGPIGNKSYINPSDLYHNAQLIDEWPGEGYDGTSVRAGAKVLSDKGFISSYNWGFTLQDVVDALLYVGPVTVGTYWYDSMFEVTSTGFIKITDSSGIAGGHAYLLNGVNTTQKKLRVKNSWGRDWGNNGNAWMSFNTFERLLNEEGEACLATEVSR